MLHVEALVSRNLSGLWWCRTWAGRKSPRSVFIVLNQHFIVSFALNLCAMMGSIFFWHRESRETSGAGGQLRRPWALFLQMGLGPLSYRSQPGATCGNPGWMDLRSASADSGGFLYCFAVKQTQCRLWLCLFSRQNLERMLKFLTREQGLRPVIVHGSWGFITIL